MFLHDLGKKLRKELSWWSNQLTTLVQTDMVPQLEFNLYPKHSKWNGTTLYYEKLAPWKDFLCFLRKRWWIRCRIFDSTTMYLNIRKNSSTLLLQRSKAKFVVLVTPLNESRGNAYIRDTRRVLLQFAPCLSQVHVQESFNYYCRTTTNKSLLMQSCCLKE